MCIGSVVEYSGCERSGIGGRTKVRVVNVFDTMKDVSKTSTISRLALIGCFGAVR